MTLGRDEPDSVTTPPPHPHAADLDDPPAVTPSLGREETTELLPSSGPFRRILHAVGLAEQALGTFLIVVILVLVLVQVVQRYLPGAGWPWTGEVARLALVWCTFILSGYLMAFDRHIQIQVIDYVLSRRALGLVKLLVHAAVLATCLAMSYASYRLIADDIGQRTAAAEIPLVWIYVVPMVGFALTAVRAALAIGVLDIAQVRGREESGT